MAKRKSTERDNAQLGLFGALEVEVSVPAKVQPHVFSVTELTQCLSRTIEMDPVLGQSVKVQGELSNVSVSSRGHMYFMLKDGGAALKGVLWASQVKSLKFEPTDGLEVFVTGRLEVYAPGGTYSLVTQRMEPVGVGALQLAFEQLKERLSAEGLFDPEFKQPIPQFPKKIGMITSPTGAVIHDMLRVIRRKNPLVDVLLLPVPVQGEGAAEKIAEALRTINAFDTGVDVILLARGGGSFEDLFCFSEEPVVRAVFESRIPVVTGIGHEPDYSLADAASDYRASTPTAAAEYVVPDVEALQMHLVSREEQLCSQLQQHLRHAEQRFDLASTQFTQYLGHWVQSTQDKLWTYATQLEDAMVRHLTQGEQQISAMAAQLEAYSPLSTLKRGYVIALDSQQKALYSARQLASGTQFQLQFYDGHVTAEVLPGELD